MTSPPLAPRALLYSIAEAAQVTSLSASFLRSCIASGDLPAVKIGRLVRLRPSDLSAYIDAHARHSKISKD